MSFTRYTKNVNRSADQSSSVNIFRQVGVLVITLGWSMNFLAGRGGQTRVPYLNAREVCTQGFHLFFVAISDAYSYNREVSISYRAPTHTPGSCTWGRK